MIPYTQYSERNFRDLTAMTLQLVLEPTAGTFYHGSVPRFSIALLEFVQDVTRILRTHLSPDQYDVLILTHRDNLTRAQAVAAVVPFGHPWHRRADNVVRRIEVKAGRVLASFGLDVYAYFNPAHCANLATKGGTHMAKKANAKKAAKKAVKKTAAKK